MVTLIIIAILVIWGIYYVTTLDFEVGSGISERKASAKDAEYTIRDATEHDEETKELQ